MRKTILILLLAFPILSFAQENYLPFLEDGKVWSTVRKYPAGEAEYRMEVKGDTVLSGKKCKIVQLTYAGVIQGNLYYHEDNGKLYQYRNDKKFWLIYDLEMTETGWHDHLDSHYILLCVQQANIKLQVEHQEKNGKYIGMMLLFHIPQD